MPGEPHNSTGTAAGFGVAVGPAAGSAAPPRPWTPPEPVADGPGDGAGPEARPGAHPHRRADPATGRSRVWAGTGSAGDPTASETDAQGWSTRPAPGEPPPLPVPLRPLTTSDLVDGAWAVVTCRPRTVLALSALFILPAQIAASFLVRGSGQSFDFGTSVLVFSPFFASGSTGRALASSAAGLGALAALSLGYALLGAAIGRLVSAWYDDTDLRLGQVLGATVRVAPAVLAAWLVTSVAQVASLCLFVLPALFVFPLLLLVSPVIAIERRGPFSAIRRSAGLVGRRLGPVMGIWLVAVFLERVISFALTAVPAVLSAAAPEPYNEVVQSAGWAFSQLLTAPTVAGLSVLLYFDLRVRSEGLDLEVDAAEAFASPEAAGA